nr:hypothetical protein [Staphylococcus aureus]
MGTVRNDVGGVVGDEAIPDYGDMVLGLAGGQRADDENGRAKPSFPIDHVFRHNK